MKLPLPDPHSNDHAEKGFELLMYGNEQIIQASDNGTLVAFAALAFQQIRGKSEFYQDVGCAFLLISVLMCALVHFSIGNAFIGRAKKYLNQGNKNRRVEIQRRAYAGLALVAAGMQFLSILVGGLLVLPSRPMPFLQRLLDRLFS